VNADVANTQDGDLSTTVVSAASVGNVQVAGDVSASITAATTIGNIDGNGTDDQTLSLDGTEVGNIVFDGLDAGKGLNLTLANAMTTVGNITATSPGGSISNLYVTTPSMVGEFGLTTVGNITSDGNAQFTNHAKAVTLLGNVSVDGIFGGGATFGPAAGLTLGAANNGTISIDTTAVGGSSVTFVIDNTTVPFAAPGILSQGGAPVVTAPDASGSTPSGGVTFTLV
jgi:hypothetical protein